MRTQIHGVLPCNKLRTLWNACWAAEIDKGNHGHEYMLNDVACFKVEVKPKYESMVWFRNP
jgi:hypothetical protein